MDGPFRMVFTVTLLLMWGLCAAGLALDRWDGTLWLLLALAHLACTVVFRNFTWVFNYGYALSMVFLHAVVAVVLPTPAGLVLAVIGILYGLRLGWFVQRRYRDPSYAPVKARGDRAGDKVPLPARVFLWVAVSWLMTFAALPAWHVGQAGRLTPVVLAGALLALAGLVLEAVADHQKQAAKSRAPDRWVATGLYARARHPNFAGEILFQIGLVVAVLGAADGWYALATGVVAPAYIILLMIHQARRHDADQAARFGADPAWQAYRQRSGTLLPGL
jgi:steroid 5-alpha reductase family enzyme